MIKLEKLKSHPAIANQIKSFPLYQSIIEEIKNSKLITDEEYIVPCAILLLKRKLQEDKFNGKRIYEKLSDRLEDISFNLILKESPNLMSNDFLMFLKKIIDNTKILESNDECTEEINYLIFYFEFMYSFVDILNKMFEKYFDSYDFKSREFNSQYYLKYTWFTFAYLKKIILKRKNDITECSFLISKILEILKNEIQDKDNIFKLSTYSNKIYMSDFNNFVKDISSYFKLENSKFNLSNSQLEKCLSFYECTNLKFEFFSPNNYNILIEKYYQILIPDEIDDYKIFENFYLDSRLKNTPTCNKVNYMWTNTNNIRSLQSTANSQKIESNDKLSTSPIKIETSPIKFKSHFQENITLDNFLKGSSVYNFLDLSYLYKKFSVLKLNNEIFLYHTFYDEFDKHFISVYLKEDFKDDLEFNYDDHKNLYLKLLEETLNKIKCNKNEINLILNEECFLHNFFIFSIYTYLNLIYIEKPILSEKITIKFIKNINQYKYFNMLKLLSILSNLIKLNIPIEIKNVIKNLETILLIYVIWQKDSFLFKIHLNKNADIQLADGEQASIKNIIRLIYTHTCSTIDRMVKFCCNDGFTRNKVWQAMKFLFSVEPTYLKDMFLDSVILLILNYFSSNYEQKSDSLRILINKYREIKKNYTIQLFDTLYNESNDYLSKNEIINERFCSIFKKNSCETQIVFEPIYKIMFIESEFNNFIHHLSSNYNIILSVSPNAKISYNDNLFCSSDFKNNENSHEYLQNKRIRQLTPPSLKLSSLSPFNKNKSPNTVNSAFKNLNPYFNSITKKTI